MKFWQIAVSKWLGIVVLMAAVLLTVEGRAHSTPPAIGKAPAVEHRIVLDVSTASPVVDAQVLANIHHLIEGLAPDPVTIEVVCRGQGLDLLLSANNPYRTRIEHLADSGRVNFVACANTMKGRKFHVLTSCLR